MKEDKEIIDYIVDRLKESGEQPYRTGAWEKFRAEHIAPKASVYRMNKIWYAAASIVLLMGVWGAWYMTREESDVVKELALKTEGQKETPMPTDQPVSQEDRVAVLADNNKTINQEKPLSVHDEHPAVIPPLDRGSARLALLGDPTDIEVSTTVHIPAMLLIEGRDLSLDRSAMYGQDIENVSRKRFEEHLASTSMQQGMVLAMKEVEGQNQSQRVRLNDRFDLGVFVSPYATGQKMNVGGGLALAYKLNNRLSVRTGASYNNYEVNMLKDPVQEESKIETVVEEKSSMRMEAVSSTAYQNKLIIPNINAIRGFVQSIEVPVELKLNVNRTLYAVAGMSYSAILNQERNAYYVENINTETFADGYPENKQQAERAVKPVTKAVESMENNVSPNGFSGFVNFSIGKELKLNKSMGISLEPYLKIPVGQYRRADMDYTNGGIRIMTNF